MKLPSTDIGNIEANVERPGPAVMIRKYSSKLSARQWVYIKSPARKLDTSQAYYNFTPPSAPRPPPCITPQFIPGASLSTPGRDTSAIRTASSLKR
jgi:hypothetical protein